MKQLLFILGCLLFFACAEEVIKKPDPLLAKEKMVDIYYDLALLRSIRSVAPAVLTDNQIETLPYVYKKHGVDSLVFAKNNLYYASLPLEYQSIFEAVEKRLEEQQAHYEDLKQKREDSIKERYSKKKDSIKQLPKITPKYDR